LYSKPFPLLSWEKGVRGMRSIDSGEWGQRDEAKIRGGEAKKNKDMPWHVLIINNLMFQNTICSVQDYRCSGRSDAVVSGKKYLLLQQQLSRIG